jgi:hypothetical protein
MLEAERKYISRQSNYQRVPHPLVEGLIFMAVSPPYPEQCTSANFEWFEKQVEHLSRLEIENEIAKTIEDN